jgi:hypothetical protein
MSKYLPENSASEYIKPGVGCSEVYREAIAGLYKLATLNSDDFKSIAVPMDNTAVGHSPFT